jgi:hypothetical protein
MSGGSDFDAGGKPQGTYLLSDHSVGKSAPILVSNFVSLHFPCFLATYWVKFLLLAFAPVLAAKTLNAPAPLGL